MAALTFRRSAGAPPFIFGHRGVRGEAPENTMAAFELAAASGADGIELDVRLARSGEVVVCHDPTLARYTEGRDTRAIADLDAGELARADVGDGQPVPMLDQVLAWARPKGLRVNVEMKRDVPDRRKVVRETARILRLAGSADVIVSSFDPWMLAYFGFILPSVPRGCLFASDQKFRALQTSGWVAAILRASAVHPDKTLVTTERCQRWKKRGHLVNVWTVNDIGRARELSEMGVDAIITDVPRDMARALR